MTLAKLDTIARWIAALGFVAAVLGCGIYYLSLFR